MAARALWTGSITFGLVNVPVRIYSAVHEHKLQFHLVHEKDDGPIGYEKVCKLENKLVDNDEIVKAFEHRKGEFVHLTDEDFEAVRVEGQHTIDLEDFVPYEQIDPTFFAHTYLVGPQKGAEKTYALLVRAMSESELAGIGKFVMRNRQYLGCLRVRGRSLTLEQMHFADEVDPPAEAVPSRLPSVSDRELKMARELISGFSGRWRPEKYRDTYTNALRKLVKAKLKGDEVHRAPPPVAESPPDLMEALRQSVEQMRGGRRQNAASNGNRNGRRRARRSQSKAELEQMTKSELEHAARKLGISGRSSMSKDELVRAVASAQ